MSTDRINMHEFIQKYARIIYIYFAKICNKYLFIYKICIKMQIFYFKNKSSYFIFQQENIFQSLCTSESDRVKQIGLDKLFVRKTQRM